jgi:hypothetical protein
LILFSLAAASFHVLNNRSDFDRTASHGFGLFESEVRLWRLNARLHLVSIFPIFVRSNTTMDMLQLLSFVVVDAASSDDKMSKHLSVPETVSSSMDALTKSAPRDAI